MRTFRVLFLLGVASLPISQAVPCQRTIDVGPGVTSISTSDPASPYEDYTRCRWNITGPSDTQLTLTFEPDFDVEVTATSPEICPEDRVTIFDTARPGLTDILNDKDACSQREVFSANQIYGPHCGTVAPRPFTTKSNTAVVQFCTDYGVVRRGWRINLLYTPILQPEPWTERVVDLRDYSDVGRIESPNFPNNYFDGYTAQYRIRSLKQGSTIHVKPVVFQVGTSCSDSLNITDVTNNVVIRTFCGGRSFAEFEITTDEILVVFQTDLFDNYRGFQIEASLVVCPGNQFACDNQVGCYDPAASCDGTNYCADGSDEKLEYCAPDCGVSHFPITRDTNSTISRIVGGTTANRHSLPWQAAIAYQGRKHCGASILSDRWLMSAAHCYANRRASDFTVRVGGHLLTVGDAADRSVTLTVEKAICHPLYNRPIELDYDYCLIKTATKIPFRKNISPICIPRQGEDTEPGTRCMVSGWGDTLLPFPVKLGGGEEGDAAEQAEDRSNPALRVSADRLQQTYLPVIERVECNKTSVGIVTDRMICAGFFEGGTNSCHGDSGGPFVCQLADGRWTLAGSVSHGPSVCASRNVPAVYARTGSVTNWIIDTLSSQ
ncbi:putative Transmembrane protease serine 9 [Hypsibius exemplaris]|uniref:Transmembrane protease serine 9 n=1 Tax=Hypsibius exemplaris TaxID=2072580 RepID=A0A1W0WGJ2_HYPEX|nr:putative Transmembrane protease serine 9 [Hypsibius exemplaris]